MFRSPVKSSSGREVQPTSNQLLISHSDASAKFFKSLEVAIDDAKESEDTQIRNAKSLVGQSWANYVNA